MATTSPANRLWFLNSLVTVHASSADAQDGISVLEHFVPHGFSPPLHVHRTEDEVFHVQSSPGARCLAITARGDFERFVRAVSRLAERPELPPPAGPPSADAAQALKAAAAKHGIELVGPPLQ